MHSKKRYKICSCSVILRELALSIFELLQGLQYYFPKNYRCNLTYHESENFSDSSLNHMSKSEHFRFPLFYEKLA